MPEVLSFAEIKMQFDAEWILIGDPDTGPDLNVKRGVVLWHSKDRDEVYRKARELRPGRSAILYTGQLPDDVAVVL